MPLSARPGAFRSTLRFTGPVSQRVRVATTHCPLRATNVLGNGCSRPCGKYLRDFVLLKLRGELPRAMEAIEERGDGRQIRRLCGVNDVAFRITLERRRHQPIDQKTSEWNPSRHPEPVLQKAASRGDCRPPPRKSLGRSRRRRISASRALIRRTATRLPEKLGCTFMSPM